MFQINGNLDLGKWMGWEKWLWLILSKVVGSLRAPSVPIILSYCRFLIHPFSNKLFSDRGLFWSWIIWLGVQACMERKTASKMRWTTCDIEFLDHPSPPRQSAGESKEEDQLAIKVVSSPLASKFRPLLPANLLRSLVGFNFSKLLLFTKAKTAHSISLALGKLSF